MQLCVTKIPKTSHSCRTSENNSLWYSYRTSTYIVYKNVSETYTLNKADEQKLNVFDHKILCKIFEKNSIQSRALKTA